MNTTKLQQAIEHAIQVLDELEQAIDAGDNRRIGARLFELRRALQEVKREAQQTTSRQ